MDEWDAIIFGWVCWKKEVSSFPLDLNLTRWKSGSSNSYPTEPDIRLNYEGVKNWAMGENQLPMALYELLDQTTFLFLCLKLVRFSLTCPNWYIIQCLGYVVRPKYLSRQRGWSCIHKRSQSQNSNLNILAPGTELFSLTSWCLPPCCCAHYFLDPHNFTFLPE